MDAILTAVREGEGLRRRVRDGVRSVGGGGKEKGKEMDRGIADDVVQRTKRGRGQDVRGDTFREIRGRVMIRQSSREAPSVTGNPGRQRYKIQPINTTQHSSL